MDVTGPSGSHPSGEAGQAARLDDVFEDLEQQASGMLLAERDAELADRARGEYAGVGFASRVHASYGRRVVLTLSGGFLVEGELWQAGADWCAVLPPSPAAATAAGCDDTQLGWLVPLAAIVSAAGLSERAVPEAARPLPARLGFGSALHRWSGQGRDLRVDLATGASLCGRVRRVGADFAELSLLTGAAADTALVRFAGISAVRVA